MAEQKNYSEGDFWQKLRRFTQKAGREVVEKALWLYYTAEDKDTPKWAKATVFAALAYFVCPIDVIPDPTPGIGFSDDLGVLISAVAAIAMHITPEIKKKAAEKMMEWFSDG